MWMQIFENRKSQISEGIELPKSERIRTLGEKETYKKLVILETDTIKQVEMKEKIKEYLRWSKKLWTKFSCRNFIKKLAPRLFLT